MHIVQSSLWEKFKSSFGTPTVRVGKVLYTKHAIPFTPYFYAYCPKVDPFDIDFDALRASLKQENCIAINFDVPNVLKDSPNAARAETLFRNAGCVPAPKTTFTPWNLLLDLTSPLDTLLANMHPKHRYNIRLSERRGVVVKHYTKGSHEGIDLFLKLLHQTAVRQGFFLHPDRYYKLLWDILSPTGNAELLVAFYGDEPLAAWLFLLYDSVIYYTYGGSSVAHKNLHASNVLGWEGIKLGKSRGCTLFDLWGSAKDPTDRSDPYWGFTNFKLKFGARHVTYITSYDLVLNPGLYRLFNVANKLRWRALRFRRRFGL